MYVYIYIYIYYHTYLSLSLYIYIYTHTVCNITIHRLLLLYYGARRRVARHDARRQTPGVISNVHKHKHNNDSIGLKLGGRMLGLQSVRPSAMLHFTCFAPHAICLCYTPLRHTSVCENTTLLGEPMPCNPEAGTALHTLIACFVQANFPRCLLLRRSVFFTDTGTIPLPSHQTPQERDECARLKRIPSVFNNSCLFVSSRPWGFEFLQASIYTSIYIYICVYIHIHICMYIYIYIYIHTCIYRPARAWRSRTRGRSSSTAYVCVYMYTYVYICIYVYVYVYTYMCMTICIYRCVYIYMYTHMYNICIYDIHLVLYYMLLCYLVL